MGSNPAGIPYWRLSAFYFFYYALLGGLAPYWSVYLREQGFGATEIGQIMAILMLTRLLAPNLWGWLGDVGQCRLAMVRIGSFLAMVCFTGFFWAEGYWGYVLFMAAFSFFWTAVLPQFEVITLHALGEQRPRYSQIRVWGSIGFILTVVGLGALFETASVKWLPLCLVLLLASIWLASMVPLREPAQERSSISHEGLLKVLRQRPVIAFLIVNLLLQLSHGPYYTFYSLYLQSAGYGLDQIGWLWSLGVVAEVVLFLVMHRLLASYSLAWIITASMILTAVRWFLIPVFVESIWLLALIQILHAFSFGAMHAASIEFVHRYFSGRHQGQGQALYSSIGFGAGGTAGAFLSGYLYDFGGGAITYALAGVAAAVAVPFAALWLQEKRG